jgi:integral membrane protein (TIGR01906 family)
LARKLLFACLTLLLLTVLLLLRGRILAIRPFAPLLIKGLRFAGGALVLLVLTVALWGILDFDGSFTVLHRLAFRNELWLLNPQQDLLIQLMPQPFFEEYALLGLKSTGLALAGLLALLLGENLVNRRRKR